jgi:hypothetical protein
MRPVCVVFFLKSRMLAHLIKYYGKERKKVELSKEALILAAINRLRSFI